jgi:hypothetical protein
VKPKTSFESLTQVRERLLGERIDPEMALRYNLTMDRLREIQGKVLRRQYEFSRHAVDQSIIRNIAVAELEEAISNRAEIIEDYPDDKYGPSCLILGFTRAGRPLHAQCSYPSRPLIKIVTVYEPDPDLWINLRVRKPDR